MNNPNLHQVDDGKFVHKALLQFKDGLWLICFVPIERMDSGLFVALDSVNDDDKTFSLVGIKSRHKVIVYAET